MEETFYSYNTGFDPLWSSYERSGPETMLRIETPGRSEMKDRLMAAFNQIRSGGIPPETKKEKPIMGYNDDTRSSQQKIDDAVREAIEKPRREAEIARRVALVASLEPLATAPVGTVLTFERNYGNETPVLQAAIKAEDDVWNTTYDPYTGSRGERVGFKKLLDMLTTGQYLAENVQVATNFAAPQAPASTDASA